MHNASQIKEFLFAGNATITIKSQVSGNHYTYNVSKLQGENKPELWFVSLLTGPDTFTYVGVIDAPNYTLRLTKKSSFKEESIPVKAFNFFLSYTMREEMAPKMEVRHESSCGRCGRPLTTPESIDRGIGPDCWVKMGH